MSYKDDITAAMDNLATHPLARFIGYGIRYGGKAMGTLRNVPESKLIETPVAENLMVGMATGMSLAGFRPVVFIERFDFIMNAMDALVNHLDKIQEISRNEFLPGVIIRCVVGNTIKPLYTGETHTQDFSKTLRPLLKNIDILTTPVEFPVKDAYEIAVRGYALGYSTIVVERKDLI